MPIMNEENIQAPPPNFASAIREISHGKYSWSDLRHDVIAGLTVGIVAIPLAMALAIAIDVPPQYGLYTSIVAGALIALTGGSRFNISGPTAAFVVILLPITHQYGLGGLLMATCMAGLILIMMGLTGLGRLVQYIPYPVTLGFTAGIAVVIAVLQLKDFLGLSLGQPELHFLDKLIQIAQALPSAHSADLIIGALTLGILITWRRIPLAIPGHLPALIIGSGVAWLMMHFSADLSVQTIGSRFSYWADGIEHSGIPAMLPALTVPWLQSGANGAPLELSLSMIRELIGPALAIALLGAIESLLCAVVADGMTGTKHNPNAELVGQGLGNVVAPFFGGITATAAIARTVTSIRSGAHSPLAAIIHAAVVLLAVLLLAPMLSHVPMAALAALLLMTAWNMSEAKHVAFTLRTAQRSDVAVLLTCFTLTVVFDMVIAVTVGVVLAALLFIRRMTELTATHILDRHQHPHLNNLPAEIAVYDINGPLFFGAAEKALNVLHRTNQGIKVVIIDMSDVPMIDMTALVALRSALAQLGKRKIPVVFANPSAQVVDTLHQAGLSEIEGKMLFRTDLAAARDAALELAHRAHV